MKLEYTKESRPEAIPPIHFLISALSRRNGFRTMNRISFRVQDGPCFVRGCLVLFILWCMAFAGTVRVPAQTTVTGGVRGFIYEIDAPLDARGRPPGVPGAIVTIGVPNGVTRSTVTDANGEYFFANLLPNTYTISARCDGFLPDPRTPSLSINSQVSVFLTRETVVEAPWIGLLRAGGGKTVPNAVAAPGGANPNRLLSTSGGVRSGSIDRRLLEALPLGGVRTFDAFALLFPGVAPPPPAVGNTTGPGVGAGIGTSGQFSINGLRSRANNFTMDGSDNNDEDIGVRRQGFTSLVSQSIESVQEFHVTTLLAESQFGRNLGGQVNAVSRVGERRFHGSAHGFFTDRRLMSRDPFDLTGGPANFPIVRASDSRAVQIAEQNQFFQIVNLRPLAPENPVGGESAFTRAQAGLVVSGPVGADPATFFLAYEHQAVNANRESHFAVPTVAQRGLFGSGDRGLFFSNPPNNFGALFPTSFEGDFFYSLFPFPNNPRGPHGGNTFTQVLPASAHGNVFSARMDRPFEWFGASQLLTARYNFTDDDTILPVTGEALFSTVRPLTRTQNLSLFLNSTLSAAWSNQARFSFGRTRLDFREVRNPLLLPSRMFPDTPFLLNRPALGNGARPLASGQPGDPFFVTYFPVTARETEGQTGPLGQLLVSGFSPVGVDVFNLPQARADNTFQIANTAIFVHGRQEAVFGVDTRRTQLNSRLDRNFLPQVVFNGAPNLGGLSQTGSPFDAPAFLNGTDFVATKTPTSFFQVQAENPDSRIGLRFWQIDLFAFDRIRFGERFVLTFGLRYELNTVPGESNRRIERTFDSPEVQAFIAAERARPGGRSGLERFLNGRDGIFTSDANNLAPQIGFAWQPVRNGRWVIRGGYGVNYDIIPGAVISQSRNVFPTFLSVNLPAFEQFDPFLRSVVLDFVNPATLSRTGTLNGFDRSRFSDPVQYLTDPANGLPSAGQTAGPAFVLPNANLRTPYAQHFTLTVEHALGRDVLVTAAYVGTRGVKLLRFATPNLGPNAFPRITGFSNSAFLFPDPRFIGTVVGPARPFPLLGGFTSIESDANSTYHGLQLTASKRFSHGWTFMSAYTWSHAIDGVSDLFRLGGADALPQNSFDRRAERGSANFDVRHRFVSHAVWELPFAADRRWLGGWRVAGIATFQSGQPFTVIAPYDVNLDGNLTDRPDSVAGIQVVNQGATRLQLNGPFESLLAAPGTSGRIGRNTFRGPGIACVDVALTKTFSFDGRRSLVLRAEMFNAFNRANYGLPVRQLGFPGFGTSVDTRVSPRTVQFGMRFDF